MNQPVDWLNWSLPVSPSPSGIRAIKAKHATQGRPQRRCHPPLTGDEDDDDDDDDDDDNKDNDDDGDGDDDDDNDD